LVRKLAEQGDHASVVGARRKLGEDRLVATDEEFDPENPVAAQRLDHLAGLITRRLQRLERDARRLPALAIVALLLTVADRGAEEHAVPRRDGEERDLAVEPDKLFDDHARPVAAHVGDRIIPGGAD